MGDNRGHFRMARSSFYDNNKTGISPASCCSFRLPHIPFVIGDKPKEVVKDALLLLEEALGGRPKPIAG